MKKIQKIKTALIMKKTSKKKKTPNMMMTQKIKKTQAPTTKNTPIMNMIPNTSLAAPGALAHRLRRTTCKILV